MLDSADQPRPTRLSMLVRRLTQPSPWWLWLIFFIGATSLFAWYRLEKSYPLFDTYPLYFGAKAWLANGNAYNLDPAVDPTTFGYYTKQGVFETPFAGGMHQAGNGYPLPANWLFIPLSFLTPRMHSIIWVIGLFASCLVALRWAKLPPWIMLSFPVLDGLRMEQFTIFIVLMQIIALGAWNLPQTHRRRALILAFASALMLLKPSHGLVTGLAILGYLLYQRQWWPLLISYGLIWGLPTIVDWNWPLEWLQALQVYNQSFEERFTPWWLLLFVFIFWRQRDYLACLTVSQLALVPYTWIYSNSSLLLSWAASPWCLGLSLLTWCITPIQVLLIDRMSVLDSQLFVCICLIIVPMIVLSRYRQTNGVERIPSTPLNSSDAS